MPDGVPRFQIDQLRPGTERAVACNAGMSEHLSTLEGSSLAAESDRRAWFALRVKSRCEKAVAESLKWKEYEEFLPLYRSRRRWSDRYQDVDLPLFPGYVFLRFDIERRLPVLQIPGVVHVVGRGRVPVAVEEQEIAALQTLVASGLRLQPWPFIEVGHEVSLEEGPLRGVKGIVTAVKGNLQLVVSVTLLQRSVAVKVDRRWVRPESGNGSAAGIVPYSQTA